MDHTKEPWGMQESRLYANEWFITVDKHWLMSIRHNGEQMPERQRANIRRIVACVNACAGISTESLERGTPIIAANQIMAIQGDEWKAERDALLHAAQNLRDVKGRFHAEKATEQLLFVLNQVEEQMK